MRETSDPRQRVLGGTADCQDTTPAAGLHLVGHPRPPAALGCHDWLAAQRPDAVRLIRRLDPATARWQSCGYAGAGIAATILGHDFAIQRGIGYLVSSPAGGTRVRPGCP